MDMDFIFAPLNLVTFFPLIGVLILLFLKEREELSRWVALVTSLITFGISLWVLGQFNSSDPGLQLPIDVDWIQVAGWNIRYAMGVDGLSILLVLLTTFLAPISILSTWKAVEERARDFMLFFLLLEIFSFSTSSGNSPWSQCISSSASGVDSNVCTQPSSFSSTQWQARS
jgi:NADH-quinone oxidoreductase subunit M